MAAPHRRAPRRTRDERPGGRSARVKAAVIESVLDELAASGYSGLTFERIAARAGVHKATLYRRWPTKERLIVTAMLAQSSRWVPMPDTGSVREDLRLVHRAVIAYITAPQGDGFIRALVSQAALVPEIVAIGHSFWRERFSLVGGVIQRGIDRGELPPGTDADFLIETIIGPLYLRLLVTGQPLTTAYADRVVDWAIAATRNNTSWGSPAGLDTSNPDSTLVKGVSLASRSKYPEQFRSDAVELVRSSGRSLRQVGQELGVNHETLRKWVNATRRGEAATDDGERISANEREERRRPRKKR